MPDTLINLLLGANLSLLFTAALQQLPCTRIYKKSKYPIEMAFIKGRVDFGLRLLAALLASLYPIYVFVLIRELTLWHFVLPFVLLPISVATLFPIEFQRTPKSKLIFTKRLWSPVATVHLKSHYQAFDRDTYNELLELVKLLPSKGVTQITMASPMFYYPNGELRRFQLLEKQLARHNAKLRHAPAGVFDCIIGKISMLMNKQATKTNVNLHHWHVLTINLETKNDYAYTASSGF